MDKFTGNADEFNLKVCADAIDDNFGEVVQEVTNAKLDRGNVKSLKEIMGRSAIETEPYKLSKKFYEVLCGLTTGEANVVVRGTTEKLGNFFHGFTSANIVHHEGNARARPPRLPYPRRTVSPPNPRDAACAPSNKS